MLLPVFPYEVNKDFQRFSVNSTAVNHYMYSDWSSFKNQLCSKPKFSAQPQKFSDSGREQKPHERHQKLPSLSLPVHSCFLIYLPVLIRARNVTHAHTRSDRWWSRDEHLQSALVVGEMERTVSNPQVTIVRLVGIDVGFVQLVGLIHTHTHTHTYILVLPPTRGRME